MVILMKSRFIIGSKFYVITDTETGRSYNLAFSGDINRLCELLNKLNEGNYNIEK